MPSLETNVTFVSFVVIRPHFVRYFLSDLVLRSTNYNQMCDPCLANFGLSDASTHNPIMFGSGAPSPV